MQIIDTHIHLYAEEYKGDLQALIHAAREDGVSQMLLPNIDSESIEGVKKLSIDYPGYCVPMMGLHPCYVKTNYEQELAIIEKELRTGKYIAVGEIGMDKYWELNFIREQENALKHQLKLAHELDFPVALHTRNANQEVISIIKELQLGSLRGVFHCFSGTVEEAETMIELGFYLGIGGVVTYKNGGLDKILKDISIDNLVLETDGPYLSPHPHRGKRNQPAFINYVAEKIAAIKNISKTEVADITSSNARKLFRL
jgi:TatD DNase family protein